jgi:hypothetical protein
MSGETMTPSSGRAMFHYAVLSGPEIQVVNCRRMHSTGLDKHRLRSARDTEQALLLQYGSVEDSTGAFPWCAR